MCKSPGASPGKSVRSTYIHTYSIRGGMWLVLILEI